MIRYPINNYFKYLYLFVIKNVTLFEIKNVNRIKQVGNIKLYVH